MVNHNAVHPSWSWIYWAFSCVSLVAQMVKNQPAMQETRVQSLGQEDPLEKGMVIHPSIVAWDNDLCHDPLTEEPGGLQSTE